MKLAIDVGKCLLNIYVLHTILDSMYKMTAGSSDGEGRHGNN